MTRAKLRVSAPIPALMLVAFIMILTMTACSSDSEPVLEPLAAPITEPKLMEYCYNFLRQENVLNQTRLDEWTKKEIQCKGTVTEIEGTRVKFRIEQKYRFDYAAECEFLKVSDVLDLNEGGSAAFAGKFQEFSIGVAGITVKFVDCRDPSPQDPSHGGSE